MDNRTICEVFSPQEKLGAFVACGIMTGVVVAGINKDGYAVLAAQLNNTPESLLTVFSTEGTPDWAAVVPGIPEQIFLSGRRAMVAMRTPDRGYGIYRFWDGVYSETGFLSAWEVEKDVRLVETSSKCQFIKSCRCFPVFLSDDKADLAVLLTAPWLPSAKQRLQEAGLPYIVEFTSGKK